MKILAPCIGRTVDDTTGQEATVLRGFRTASVFDIAQTDGEALPEPPAWPMVSAGPEGLYEHLVGVAGALGFPVSEVEPRGEARGWYQPHERTISIVGGHPSASKARTMLHELGHALDPICNGDPDSQPPGGRSCGLEHRRFSPARGCW